MGNMGELLLCFVLMWSPPWRRGSHVARQPDAGAHGEEGEAEDQHDGGGQQGGSEERHDRERDAGILSCLAAASCRHPVESLQPPAGGARMGPPALTMAPAPEPSGPHS